MRVAFASRRCQQSQASEPVMASRSIDPAALALSFLKKMQMKSSVQNECGWRDTVQAGVRIHASTAG